MVIFNSYVSHYQRVVWLCWTVLLQESPRVKKPPLMFLQTRHSKGLLDPYRLGGLRPWHRSDRSDARMSTVFHCSPRRFHGDPQQQKPSPICGSVVLWYAYPDLGGFGGFV